MATTPAKERRARALELHLAGATFQAIADALGYADRSNARRAVQQALDELAPDIKPHEATKVARIDAMLQGLWPKARRGDVQAIDRVIKLEQWREQLTGETDAKPAAAGGDGGSKLTKLRAIHGGQGKASAG